MNAKKLVALLLAVVMVLGLFAGCNSSDETTGTAGTTTAAPAEVDGYTYNSYATALATNWNPHTWETNSDNTVMSYIETPLANMTIQDSENGVYQWVFEAATSITDVTADHQDDLTKYNVTLPTGQTVEQTTSGYVFEIALNPELTWENGTPINADTYIYSMQQLLNPDMKNYRANLYYAGESAVAGGAEYYYQGSTSAMDNADTGVITALTDLVLGEDGVYTTDDGEAVWFMFDTPSSYFGGDTLAYYNDYYAEYGYDIFEDASFDALAAMVDENGRIPVTDETWALWTTMINMPDWGNEDESCVPFYLGYDETWAEADYDATVGCYKVDDYTIRYVTDAQIDYNYFLTSCTSNWLVYEELYEAGKDTTGTLVTTNYGTSIETTMSYGPYKLESLQDAKQMVFVQNENWYGYEKQEDGSLLSMTDFDVDGAPVQQYMTTKVVIDVMDADAAKQAFLKGQLTEWTPTADDLLNYATSEALYKVDETYTMSFFFNTDVDMLKEMDVSKGNTNSVVISNENFRKAFSLSINREEWVGSTSGYKPTYSIMNNLYFYDVYNDPTSSYRNSEPAMQAICNLYGVEYGEGTPYATLQDAYKSINGYNLTEAKELMALACDELVAAGLYTEGEDIYIRIGYTAGALTSAHNQQVALMNQYINAAAEGSGFGTITFEPVGNLTDRYSDVPNGEFAVGYGAWGGAAFYPFRNFQVYCDPDQYGINEAACWDPTTETLTLTVEGEEVTMTWQQWSQALVGTGPFATASNETKLEITAAMEEIYLGKYYRIPLASSTACFMMAYKVSYYTEEYNIMYDFGGMRLMTYNYTDAEWDAYVAECGGTLSYE